LLSLTRKSDYALVALSYLAHRAEARCSAREISEQVKVPLPVLTNILHQLLQHGIVSSTMGAKGGYLLAKKPELISLTDIVDAIEGPFRLSVCCGDEEGHDDHRCDLELSCRIKAPVRKVHQSLRQYLSRVTLFQIAFDHVPVALGFEGPAGAGDGGVQPAVVPA
jgi:Rrf2 family protein